MSKRLEAQLNKFINNGEAAKFTLGTLVLMLCCGLLIIISTFTQLNFTHPIIPLDLFSHWDKYFSDTGAHWQYFMKHYRYIPQIPAIFFILSLLDRKYSMLTVGGYILLGLAGYPIFALGGGWRYIFEYGFYYILGYIPALFFAGSIIKSGFTCRNIAQAVLVGVFTIHIIGIFYMIFISAIRHEGWTFISSWIIYQSGIKILYDFALSFAAMFVAKYLKIILWLYMK